MMSGGGVDFVSGGFGLVGLEESVAQLGGSVEVGEGEKGGFVLEVELPVRPT